VQVDPIKLTLAAPGCVLLKLRCDGPASNFAFNFSLRRYIKEPFGAEDQNRSGSGLTDIARRVINMHFSSNAL